MLSIAVIGAGLSGITCSINLLKFSNNVEITLFEKSKGLGGRMATKIMGSSNEFGFDHGAQYFTVRDKRFEAALKEWIIAGVSQEWKGTIKVLDQGKITDTNNQDQQRYVAVPGMNAIAKFLAKELKIKFDTRIVKITQKDSSEKKWTLHSENGEIFGVFDIVLISTPAEQSVSLLESVAPSLAKEASQAKSSPTWSVLLGFEKTLDLSFDGAFVHNSPLSWITRNNSKPGRPSGESWVLHASPEWSQEHLEETPDQVLEKLIEEFVKATKVPISPENPIKTSFAHRWRFANVPQPVKEKYLFDPNLSIGVCGDWCGGPRVEGAFLSGLSLAEKISDTYFGSSKY